MAATRAVQGTMVCGDPFPKDSLVHGSCTVTEGSDRYGQLIFMRREGKAHREEEIPIKLRTIRISYLSSTDEVMV